MIGAVKISKNGKSLVSKSKALSEKTEYLGCDSVDDTLARVLYDQFQEFHSHDRVPDSKHLEEILLKQKEHDLEMIGSRPTYPDLPKFNPSGASKCEFELYKAANKEEIPRLVLEPYNKRWTRNATAIHDTTQRDLLYMQKVLDNPRLTVEMLESGLPAWERNILKWEKFNHNGQEFILNGMCDGLLTDNETGERIGFEFKTKSTTIAAVGDYKMKGVQDGHRMQAVCYSILFFGDPYEDRTDKIIFMYESLAKDWWHKGAEARSDIRTFQVEITLQDRMKVLDKFASVVAMTEPPEHDCDNFFCPFKEEN